MNADLSDQVKFHALSFSNKEPYQTWQIL